MTASGNSNGNGKRLRELALQIAGPVAVLLLIGGVWQGCVTAFDLKPFLLPGPLKVLEAASSNASKIAAATGRTALAAVGGFLASLAAGTLIACGFSQSKLIRTSCYPYAIFLQTVPIVAIAPLIITWFGSGFRSVVIVAFIISLFPIITNATAGMLSIDPDLSDLFRLHRASRLQVWLKLRLPNSVPHILTGARTSSGLAVIGAIVGEFFAGYGSDDYGLGYLILQTSNQLRTAELFACVIASTLLGIAIFASMGMIHATILRRWYDA
jgi:NitT/TauT family transport system permease protein